MKSKEIEQFIVDYIADLGMYDYLALGGVFILFLILFFISIMVRKKLLLAMLIGFISIFVLIFGPFVAKYALDHSIRKSKLINVVKKELNYVNSLLVNGTIKNIGKVKFTSCTINIKILKKSKNRFKQIKNRLKPYKKYSFEQVVNLKPKESSNFRVMVDKFQANFPHTIEVSSLCKGKK